MTMLFSDFLSRLRAPSRKPLFGPLLVAAALCAPLILTSSAVRADGWVPCDASGTPLTSSDPGYDHSTGGAILLNSGKLPDVTPTGTYSSLTSWWKGAYSPNAPSSQPQNPYGGLGLSTSASNFAIDPVFHWHAGYYAPNGYSDDPDGPMPDCPDIGGTVTANLSDSLTAYFVWTGPGSAPNPANFLLSYAANASASVLYEYSGLTSGLSSTGAASLGSIYVSAAASAPGLTGYDSQSAKELKQFTPDSSGMVTISLPANVYGYSSNGINVGFWTVDPELGPWWLYQESNGDTVAYSAASANGAATPDNREVGISSYIDTSWYKGAYDIPHGTDRYQHIHQPSGNSVDSSIGIINDLQTGAHIVASGGYQANASSFANPTYNWSVSGDGAAQAIPPATFGPSLNYPNGLTTIPISIDFGSTWDPTTTKSSQISVSVKDSDGTIGNDTYSVTWHGPLSNSKTVGQRNNVPQLYGSLQTILKNASQSSTITLPNTGEIGSPDSQTAGLVVTVGGVAAGGLLLIPEVSLPVEISTLVFQAVAAGAGYQLALTGPGSNQTVDVNGLADYAEYKADVDHQVEENGDSNNTEYIRFLPTYKASDAQAALESNAENWNLDPYFNGSTAQWQGGIYYNEKDTQGDTYDVHGYEGPSSVTTVKTPNSAFRYFQWTCSYSSNP